MKLSEVANFAPECGAIFVFKRKLAIDFLAKVCYNQIIEKAI